MDRGLRQPRPRKPRRRHGAGREEHAHVRVACRDGVDHRQHGVHLADARGMEPREKACGARRARDAEAFGAPFRLFLAAPCAPGKDQRCERRRKAGEDAIEAEHRARLFRRGESFRRQRVDRLCHRIGARRRFVQFLLDLAAIGFHRRRVRVLGHVNGLADKDAETREGQVDGEAAPALHGDEAAGRDRAGHHRPPRLLRELDDAFAGAARRPGRHVRRHHDGAALAERAQRPAEGRCAAAVALPRAGARTPYQLRVLPPQRCAEKLGVAMPRDHRPRFHFLRLELRQEQELPVPHRHDLRVMRKQLAARVLRLPHLRARRAHEADIAVGENATGLNERL